MTISAQISGSFEILLNIVVSVHSYVRVSAWTHAYASEKEEMRLSEREGAQQCQIEGTYVCETEGTHSNVPLALSFSPRSDLNNQRCTSSCQQNLPSQTRKATAVLIALPQSPSLDTARAARVRETQHCPRRFVSLQ